MAKRRPPKKNDEEMAQKGFELLMGLVRRHPEIEASLWPGICWGSIANCYVSNGITYEEFCQECKSMMRHFEKWWEEDDN